ncbi:hypothetical protein C8J55DRAFT_528063 [Lentinula edodes]|uniref:Secreted protein n=1 Tax=Lentinula lateritia TaxID=40482 RepID=A0A9W8ZSB9_9AGAR|nr:hypothetical protein C8J55DRAFT_528063 [Lentinula edodes]
MFLQIFHPTLLVARVCQADCCDRAKSCKLIWKMPLYRVQIFGTVTRRPVSLPVPWNFYLEQMGISKFGGSPNVMGPHILGNCRKQPRM